MRGEGGEEDKESEGGRAMTDPSPTHRWRGVLAVTLVAGGLALVAKRPALLLSAVVGVVFVAYARVTPPPSPAIELDRGLDGASPSHGDRVDVTTTVRNVGDRTLFDLRIVDGVPPALAVVDGTPRHGTVLRPGESATFSYAVAARRAGTGSNRRPSSHATSPGPGRRRPKSTTRP